MNYPAKYVKGERTRVARNAADSVALEFEGYRSFEEAANSGNVPYRQLQKQAKELGIPATGTHEELLESVVDAMDAKAVPTGYVGSASGPTLHFDAKDKPATPSGHTLASDPKFDLQSNGDVELSQITETDPA